MVAKNKILVLPHVGSAYGHLIRTAEYIQLNYNSGDDVTIVIPQHAVEIGIKCIPSFVKIIIQQTEFSINNSSGELKIRSFLQLMKELENIVHILKPNLIIGDPGVRASILSQKFSIKWIGLMHGCYLPKPKVEHDSINQNLKMLIDISWKVATKSIDRLISESTKGLFSSWEDIRSTGEILIPNNQNFEPSPIGEYIGSKNHRNGWDHGDPVKLLITFCSEGDVAKITNWEKLFGVHEKISIAGLNLGKTEGNVRYLGNNFCYESLVNSETTVITHGGHGTLKSIEMAKKVYMIPTDVDQLCNSIIAHLYRGWNIVFDKNWFEILESGIPFKRSIYWDNVRVINNNIDIELEGFDLQTLQSQYYKSLELV